jgi:hypothetical protein
LPKAKFSLQLVTAALIPLLLVVAHEILWPGPISVFNWGEPDFGYLFNSADIRFGSPPGHVDHPGTTVQSFGVAMLVALEWLRGGLPGFGDWYDDFLRNPGLYHYANSLALALVAALGLWAMAAGLLRRGHALGLVVLLQLLPFLEYNAWYYIPRVSPEKLLFFLNCGFAGFLATREGEERRRPAFALTLGFLLGFALSTKYNCITLFGFLLLVPTVPLALLAFGAAALTFFFFTLPMAELYAMSFRWLGRLGGHQGLYGKGEKGFVPSPETLAENFGILWHEDSWYLSLCLLAVAMGLFLFWRRRSRDGLACALILTAHFVMVLKHPATRYLVPMTAPLLLVAFHAFRGRPRLFPWLAAAAVLPVIPIAAEKPIHTVMGVHRLAPIQTRMDAYRARHPGCAWAYISPTPRVEWALSAGNGSAFRRHTSDLLKHYPASLSYDVSPPRFHRYSVELPAAVAQERMEESNGCFLLGGITYYTAEEHLKDAPFTFEILHNEPEGFYVLKVKKFLGER